MERRNIISYTTAEYTKMRLEKDAPIFFRNDLDEQENELIVLYPQIRYQRIKGFGGAITDSSALIWKKLSEDKRQELISACFGKEGLGYTIFRSHIQSCDFTLGNYSYIEENDVDLRTFSIDHDKAQMIPMMKAAIKASKERPYIMASPWSPPAFMKDTGRMNRGGSLKKDYYHTWAKMIAMYIKAYREEGIYINAITAQNEPHAAQRWESCQFSAEEEAEFIGEYLSPVLQDEGLGDIEIYFWDHNKERILDRAFQMATKKNFMNIVKGVAFHWYSGDHFESLRMFHEKFPEHDIVLTEYSQETFMRTPPWMHPERAAHELIGDLNNFVTSCIDWNLVLDNQGGPTYIGNYCNAPIIADIENDRLEYRPAYYYICHFSRFILPGAVRIGMSNYSNLLEVTAFENCDGKTVVVVLNPTEKIVPFTLKYGMMIADFSMLAHSIKTIIF